MKTIMHAIRTLKTRKNNGNLWNTGRVVVIAFFAWCFIKLNSRVLVLEIQVERWRNPRRAFEEAKLYNSEDNFQNE
jgi:hypothetical protein